MKKNHSIFIKLFLALILCVGIFVSSSFFMNKKGAKTISAIGDIYMHNMSKELSLHFTSTIDLRFSQLEALITFADLHRYNHQSLVQYLSDGAKIRDFEYLAFYTSEGTLVPIFGDELTLENSESFFSFLEKGEKRITTGSNSLGHTQVLIGLPSTTLHLSLIHI